ncbi:PREDICTED: uncharacterized protein C9orf171 homolog [Acanthisitta chloris]|uniref:uncharacterized protein C9orf171 homolog n=1 Tax=Acanthisitta chloris TaxID=57068 RepID=UPI0004F0D1BA|nr:PREDICTED: uncharacterized protein C9orf171 homolog [Acanthisitta chloris]
MPGGAELRRPLTLAEAGPGTENERLGVVRASMLRNPLILKEEVGKPQRNCYSLPGFDFTYGLYIPRTEGVAEAIGHWNTVDPRFTERRIMGRDFITMNRGALKEGCVTAREHNMYYKFKDLRLKGGPTHSRRRPPKIPMDMTFGMPPRPSTPLFDLLQHRYKELWMEKQRARTIIQRVEKNKSQLTDVRDTYSSYLRKHPLPAKKESFWHLRRFEKVGPHLSTFPDPDARRKAFSASH